MDGDPKPPERLWKYRVWDSVNNPISTDFARQMIVDGALYFATALQLNDPFELQWPTRLPTSEPELSEFVRELCRKRMPQVGPVQHQINFNHIRNQILQLVRN